VRNRELGLLLASVLRSGGIALASACRTNRRSDFNFFATSWIVPPELLLPPYPRIAPLCVSCPSAPHRYGRQFSPFLDLQGGPYQKRKVGQFSVARSQAGFSFSQSHGATLAKKSATWLRRNRLRSSGRPSASTLNSENLLREVQTNGQNLDGSPSLACDEVYRLP